MGTLRAFRSLGLLVALILLSIVAVWALPPIVRIPGAPWTATTSLYRPWSQGILAEAQLFALVGLLILAAMLSTPRWPLRLAGVLMAFAILGAIWDFCYEPPLGRVGGLAPTGIPFVASLCVVFSCLRLRDICLTTDGHIMTAATAKAFQFTITDLLFLTASVAALLTVCIRQKPELPRMSLRGYLDNGFFGLCCSAVVVAAALLVLGKRKLALRLAAFLLLAPGAGLASVSYLGWSWRNIDSHYPAWLTSEIGILLTCYLFALRAGGFGFVRCVREPVAEPARTRLSNDCLKRFAEDKKPAERPGSIQAASFLTTAVQRKRALAR